METTQNFENNGGYAAPPQSYDFTPQRTISIISELSPQQHLRGIMKEFEGYLWDEKSQKYVQVEGIEPFMNEDGRNIFFQFATATISPINTMSNYTRDYKLIHNLVLMQVEKASIHFHLHYRDYGISKKTQINIITDKLMILSLSCFYKAIGAGDRAAATRNISESINTLMKPDQQVQEPIKKTGVIGRMLGN